MSKILYIIIIHHHCLTVSLNSVVYERMQNKDIFFPLVHKRRLCRTQPVGFHTVLNTHTHTSMWHPTIIL